MAVMLDVVLGQQQREHALMTDMADHHADAAETGASARAAAEVEQHASKTERERERET